MERKTLIAVLVYETSIANLSPVKKVVNSIFKQLQNNYQFSNVLFKLRATFHLTISMRGQRATGKIQRNNYHHGSCGSSLTGKTLSVSLIFTHRTHRNVKNR